MAACCRCVLSAATVSRTAGSVVVKKAWNRQRSNKVPCPSAALRSGIRRATSWPGTWSAFFCPAKAVKPIPATSAREIHCPVVSSWTASGYSMVCHVDSPMPAIAALTWG